MFAALSKSQKLSREKGRITLSPIILLSYAPSL